jgi:hypothetical protein
LVRFCWPRRNCPPSGGCRGPRRPDRAGRVPVPPESTSRLANAALTLPCWYRAAGCAAVRQGLCVCSDKRRCVWKSGGFANPQPSELIPTRRSRRSRQSPMSRSRPGHLAGCGRVGCCLRISSVTTQKSCAAGIRRTHTASMRVMATGCMLFISLCGDSISAATRHWQTGTWTTMGTKMTPWVGDAAMGNRPIRRFRRRMRRR